MRHNPASAINSSPALEHCDMVGRHALLESRSQAITRSACAMVTSGCGIPISAACLRQSFLDQLDPLFERHPAKLPSEVANLDKIEARFPVWRKQLGLRAGIPIPSALSTRTAHRDGAQEGDVVNVVVRPPASWPTPPRRQLIPGFAASCAAAFTLTLPAWKRDFPPAPALQRHCRARQVSPLPE